jgi:hypothetical protein
MLIIFHLLGNITKLLQLQRWNQLRTVMNDSKDLKENDCSLLQRNISQR